MEAYERVRYFVRRAASVGLLVVSTIIALLFGEVVVRRVVPPGNFLTAILIQDSILGQRIKPYTTGHDALGFRNPVKPEHAAVIAIGDSHTYGINATEQDSWPHQLGLLLHEPVYNMALGGYGPLEYDYLAEHQARDLHPKLLLVGFYFGNDLLEAYRAAHQRSYWYSWRESGSLESGDSAEQAFANLAPKKHLGVVRDWLSRHSVLYSMLRVTLFSRLASWEQRFMARQVPPDREMLWIDPANHSIRTIFTPELRLSVVNPALPSVQEGLRITTRVFASLKRYADSAGIEVLVVLLPTKEGSYCRYLKDSGGPLPNALVKLCEAEEQVKKDLVHSFAARKIPYVDVTGAMEASVLKHIQLYTPDSDGHPQATGYRVIARAVYGAIRDLQTQGDSARN